jgi:hypothetical protein
MAKQIWIWTMNYLIIQNSEKEVMFEISLCLQSATALSAWLVKDTSFYVWGSVHRKMYINNCPTRCNNIQFIYICKLVYMFQVVTPHIIRSSYHCICSIWHYWDRTATCLEQHSQPDTFQTGSSTVSIMPDTADTSIWVPDDVWSYNSKHVEQFTNINKLYIVASCCTIINIYWDTSFHTVWALRSNILCRT